VYFEENLNQSRIKSSQLTNKSRIIHLLYTLFLVLTPFYFWRSGIPQIADFIFVLLVVTYLFKIDFLITLIPASRNFLLTGLLFAFYVLCVNLIWSIILSTTELFLLRSTYYMYNLLVCGVTVALYVEYREKFIYFIFKTVWLSLTIQFLIYLVMGGLADKRMTIFYNNPNQLGYFALLSACLIIFASSKIRVKLTMVISGLMFAFILISASQSRGALLSFFGLVLLFLVSKSKKDLKKKLYLVFILASVAIFVVYQTTNVIQDNRLLQTVQMRIESIGTRPYDSPEGRGYYRITEYPNYWIFGAGEGEWQRFDSTSKFHSTSEFHSTIGNIQVSYGIIGSLLFFLMIYYALKNDRFMSWYLIIAILFYGLTHNGIRISLFWILLALMACGHNVINDH